MITMIIDRDYEQFLKQLKFYNSDYEVIFDLKNVVCERENIMSSAYLYSNYSLLTSKYFYAFYDELNRELIKLPNIYHDTSCKVEQFKHLEIGFFPEFCGRTFNEDIFHVLLKNIEYIIENYGKVRIHTVNDSVTLLLRHLYNLDERFDRSGFFTDKKGLYGLSFLKNELRIRKAMEEIYGLEYTKEKFNTKVFEIFVNEIDELFNNKEFKSYYQDDKYKYLMIVTSYLFNFDKYDTLDDDIFINVLNKITKHIKNHREVTNGFSLFISDSLVSENYSKEKIKAYYNFLFDIALAANNNANNKASLSNLSDLKGFLSYSEIEKLPLYEKYKNRITKYITKNKSARILELTYNSIPELIDWSKEDEDLLRETFPEGIEIGDFKLEARKKEITIDNYPTSMFQQYPNTQKYVLALSYIIYGQSDDYINEMAVGFFNVLNQGYYSKEAKNCFSEALYTITAGRYEITSENFKKFLNKFIEKIDETNCMTVYRKYMQFINSCKLTKMIDITNRSDKFKSLVMEYKLKK